MLGRSTRFCNPGTLNARNGLGKHQKSFLQNLQSLDILQVVNLLDVSSESSTENQLQEVSMIAWALGHFRLKLNHQKSDIIFHFSGKILPVSAASTVKADQLTAVPAEHNCGPPQYGTDQAHAVTPRHDAIPPFGAAQVMRKVAICGENTLASSVNKNLFQSSPKTNHPQGKEDETTYRRKEAELWSQLFK